MDIMIFLFLICMPMGFMLLALRQTAGGYEHYKMVFYCAAAVTLFMSSVAFAGMDSVIMQTESKQQTPGILTFSCPYFYINEGKDAGCAAASVNASGHGQITFEDGTIEMDLNHLDTLVIGQLNLTTTIHDNTEYTTYVLASKEGIGIMRMALTLMYGALGIMMILFLLDEAVRTLQARRERTEFM